MSTMLPEKFNTSLLASASVAKKIKFYDIWLHKILEEEGGSLIRLEKREFR